MASTDLIGADREAYRRTIEQVLDDLATDRTRGLTREEVGACPWSRPRRRSPDGAATVRELGKVLERFQARAAAASAAA